MKVGTLMPSSIKIADDQLLNVILARLRNGRFETKGEKEGADKLLFNPIVQRKCNQQPEFWYAQVLVAALQNKGFHLAFLTANETKMLTPYSDKQDQKVVDVDTMIAFFKSYRDNPLYAQYRDKIEHLIKFYEGIL